MMALALPSGKLWSVGIVIREWSLRSAILICKLDLLPYESLESRNVKAAIITTQLAAICEAVEIRVRHVDNRLQTLSSNKLNKTRPHRPGAEQSEK